MTLRPALSIRPTAIGRPGRIAIRQKTASPRLASTIRVWSASPTLAPPVVITASAASAAVRKAASRASGSSRTTPRSSTSTPRRCSIAQSV